MNKKVKQQRFLYTHKKKLILGHLIRPGFGSGLRRPDPEPTKKVRTRPDLDPQHCSLYVRTLNFAYYLAKRHYDLTMIFCAPKFLTRLAKYRDIYVPQLHVLLVGLKGLISCFGSCELLGGSGWS
jgi:hypothetical protein